MHAARYGICTATPVRKTANSQGQRYLPVDGANSPIESIRGVAWPTTFNAEYAEFAEPIVFACSARSALGSDHDRRFVAASQISSASHCMRSRAYVSSLDVIPPALSRFRERSCEARVKVF